MTQVNKGPGTAAAAKLRYLPYLTEYYNTIEHRQSTNRLLSYCGFHDHIFKWFDVPERLRLTHH